MSADELVHLRDDRHGAPSSIGGIAWCGERISVVILPREAREARVLGSLQGVLGTVHSGEVSCPTCRALLTLATTQGRVTVRADGRVEAAS